MASYKDINVADWALVAVVGAGLFMGYQFLTNNPVSKIGDTAAKAASDVESGVVTVGQDVYGGAKTLLTDLGNFFNTFFLGNSGVQPRNNVLSGSGNVGAYPSSQITTSAPTLPTVYLSSQLPAISNSTTGTLNLSTGKVTPSVAAKTGPVMTSISNVMQGIGTTVTATRIPFT